MINLKETIVRYEQELLESVAPFWEKNCVDREFGGYFTSLDRDGSVYDTEKVHVDAMADRLHVRHAVYD